MNIGREMNESQIRPTINKSAFFLLWIGINMGGWVAWYVFSTTPIVVNYIDVQSFNVLSYIGLFIIGGGMGILQWSLLKRQFSIAWYEWTILTTIGFVLGFYTLIWAALRDFYMVYSPPGTPVLEWDPLLGGALLGLALGCQTITWRPRLARMLIWIVVNVVGWSLGMFLPQLAAFLLHDSHTPWLSNLFPIIFAPVVTGITLLWFLRGQHDLDKQI
jgi:hypothetical protein